MMVYSFLHRRRTVWKETDMSDRFNEVSYDGLAAPVTWRGYAHVDDVEYGLGVPAAAGAIFSAAVITAGLVGRWLWRRF